MTEAKAEVTATGADISERSWKEALAVYLHRRVIAMAFLGFSAGLPFLLIFSTLSFWLREAGIERSTIGFFSWVGITFSIKFLWAPFVDRLPLPFLTRWLGKRRSWILLAQFAIAGSLLGIAVSEPSQENVGWIALLAFVVAFSAATQDVGIDAFRIEAVGLELQGAMSASYQFGYRVALLVAGAGALYIADFFSWSVAYVAMAAFMAVGVTTTLVVAEPTVVRNQATEEQEHRVQKWINRFLGASGRPKEVLDWIIGAVICPIVDFFVRNGWFGLVILALVGLYRLSDITMGIMANPFYVDIGFTKSEVASVTKVFGLIMTIVGTFVGGILVARLGILRPLLLGAVLVATTNLLFAWLATTGEANVTYLTVTISADNLSAGLAGACFIAYLSSLTNRAYTATQYALFSSLFTLPGKFIGGFSGVVVDTYGYTDFFIYAAALGMPAILLVIYFLQRERALRASEGYAA